MKRLVLFLMMVLGGWVLISAEMPARAQTVSQLFLPSVQQPQAASAEVVALGEDFTHTDIVATADGRTFLIGKSGLVLIMDADGTVLPTPFLDIRDQVVDEEFEQGFYTLALHPDFAQNGTFYASYLAEGDADDHWLLTISQFEISAETDDVADPTSEQVLLQIRKEATIHYGGGLRFGPHDGYLYITIGDDENGANAQSGDTLLGKVLRIDVDPASGSYTIPPSNPFVGDDAMRDEIFALGLRNPWRISFDPTTHDAYLVDVGQARWEEVNLLPAGDAGGRNFGWPCLEADDIYESQACDPDARYVDPIFVYGHEGGRCSITGGVVYTGSDFPQWRGRYLFGDFCTGELLALGAGSNGGWSAVGQGSIKWPLTAIGSAPNGEVLLGGFSSRHIWQMVPSGESAP